MEVEDHWRDAIKERTKRFFENDGALEKLLNGKELRAYHWDGRSAVVSLKSIQSGRPEIVTRDSHEKLSFSSVDDLIAGGWAVAGEAIRYHEGKEYGKPSNIFGGLKFLALGETTHCAEHPIGDAPFDETCVGVADHVRDGDYSFHKGVTTVLSTKMTFGEVAAEEREKIWDSIAFSNVIPVVAAEGAGQRVPDRLFNLCTPFLDDLFDQLKPDVVMAFSVRAWEWLHWGLVNGRVKWQQAEPPVRIKGAVCGFTNHPRGGISYAAAKQIRDMLIVASKASHSG